MESFKLLIGGSLVAGDLEMPVLNPATAEPFADAPRASAAQAEAAIEAARLAFPAWRGTSWDDRLACIARLTARIREEADTLARLLVSEQGKPLEQAMGEVLGTCAFLDHLANLAIETQIIDDSAGRRVEAHRRPLGVVACISPWNYPMLIGLTKLAFALAAGNTVVAKPAPTTPLTMLKIGEWCAEIFPPGVVNVIADANDLGPLLSTHPHVAKVSFTGSTETGRKVMASAASSIKRLTLELGGNDAAIILADADPAAVAPALFGSAMLNSGQVCLAIKRVYAHASIYDRLCDELAVLAEAAVVDEGLAQGVQLGPVQNQAQFDKVCALIETAECDGTIVAGGTALDRPGYFIRPTIVRDVRNGHRIVDEEQFGPVLPVIRFDDDASAVEMANDSPYGLGASVWSSDNSRARLIAEQIEAGTVWINKHLDFGPDIPLGGAKQSGFGVELALEGLLEFTQIQVINEAR